MNVQLTTMQVILIFVAWFVLGTALDIIKIAISSSSKSVRSISNSIYLQSQSTKNNLNLSREIKIEVVIDFLDEIKNFFREIKISLLSWSKNFLQQIIEKDPDNIEYIVTEVEKESNNENKPENKYAGQLIIGSLIEFVALLSFIYADACQGAQTYSVLIPTAVIPKILNNIVVPLIIASAGTAFILGIFIGDILHLTHFGVWGKLKGWSRKIILSVLILNLIITITLAALIALYRADLLGTQSENIRVLAIYAQSLVIVPMLITTVFLFRGVFGFLAILALLFKLLAIPFVIFEFVIAAFGKLVKLGVISIDFVLSRVIWLFLGFFELLFDILEKCLYGAFLVINTAVTIVLYIPYLIINLSISKITTGNRIIDYIPDLNNIYITTNKD